MSIVQTIATYQKSWTSVSFRKYGALYYAKDFVAASDSEALYTDADGFMIKDSRFAIGPSTGREMNDDGRATVEFDRGPCISPGHPSHVFIRQTNVA